METCLAIEGVDEAPHEKKPVLRKVKDKVKKIKNTLEKKMHGEHHHDLDEEEEEEEEEDADYDAYEEDDEEQETDHPDVHGVHHGPPHEVEIEDRVVLGDSIGPLEVDPDGPTMETRVHRDGGEEVDLSQPLQSKLEDMTISSQHKEEEEGEEATRPQEKISAMEYGKKVANMVLEKVKPRGRFEGREKVADKGVSVREYLVEKLRPGEDDKALSEVISEMVHRTKEEEEEEKMMKGEMKVVERIRETLTSLLGASPEHDEQPRVVMQGEAEREKKLVQEEDLQ